MHAVATLRTVTDGIKINIYALDAYNWATSYEIHVWVRNLYLGTSSLTSCMKTIKYAAKLH